MRQSVAHADVGQGKCGGQSSVLPLYSGPRRPVPSTSWQGWHAVPRASLSALPEAASRGRRHEESGTTSSAFSKAVSWNH